MGSLFVFDHQRGDVIIDNLDQDFNVLTDDANHPQTIATPSRRVERIILARRAGSDVVALLCDDPQAIYFYSCIDMHIVVTLDIPRGTSAFAVEDRGERLVLAYYSSPDLPASADATELGEGIPPNNNEDEQFALLCVYDIANLQRIGREWLAHDNNACIYVLAFQRGLLFSAGFMDDHTCKIWSPDSRELLFQTSFSSTINGINRLIVHPLNNVVFISGNMNPQHPIVAWNWATSAKTVLTNVEGYVQGLAIHSDGSIIACTISKHDTASTSLIVASTNLFDIRWRNTSYPRARVVAFYQKLLNTQQMSSLQNQMSTM